ncbi:hypothetical protein MMC07_002978 [Pseudocyphellaria aurata]|nr:hypothetical protein [Pseudocyphellaria aurata]
MPVEVSDIKQFIEICRRKDASSARIKRNRKTNQIKFKVRCRRFLYTLVLKDSDKADKLKQSLPPSTFNLLLFFFVIPSLPTLFLSVVQQSGVEVLCVADYKIRQRKTAGETPPMEEKDPSYTKILLQ